MPFQVDSEAAEMLEHERHGEKDVLIAGADPPLEFVSSAYSSDNSAVEGFSFLDNFYKKYNKVLLDKTSTNKTKQNKTKQSKTEQYETGKNMQKTRVNNKHACVLACISCFA